jgi:hypothetical protein
MQDQGSNSLYAFYLRTVSLRCKPNPVSCYSGTHAPVDRVERVHGRVGRVVLVSGEEQAALELRHLDLAIVQQLAPLRVCACACQWCRKRVTRNSAVWRDVCHTCASQNRPRSLPSGPAALFPRHKTAIAPKNVSIAGVCVQAPLPPLRPATPPSTNIPQPPISQAIAVAMVGDLGVRPRSSQSRGLLSSVASHPRKVLGHNAAPSTVLYASQGIPDCKLHHHNHHHL